MEASVTTAVCPMDRTDVGLGSRHGHNIIPKLRKNRRIDNKWGLQYHIAVQDAVFGRQCLSYMPTEPPASLSEEIVESDPLYVCKQCKDCFRFQSSFEDHNKRRSWILGLWCHSCFITVCTHITETGSACPICMKKDSEKRSYLRTRGLNKNQKLGAIKVFYNQCQLFEHVKMHGLSSIDMGDLMLMPLPTDMSNNDWSFELEITCEALMEHTFLLRMHIVDWLKRNKLEDNWWKLIKNNIKNDDNLIGKLVTGYQGRQLFKTFEKLTVERFTGVSPSNAVHNINKTSNIEFIDAGFKDKDRISHSFSTTSDKNISENEDNPCMSTDIAFIDCGPTSKFFEPESSAGYMPRKRITVVTKLTQNTPNWCLADAVKLNNKRKNVVLGKTANVTRGNTVNVKTNKRSKCFVVDQSYKNLVQQHKIAQSFIKKITGNSISKPMIKTGINKILDKSVKTDIPFSAKRIKLHKTTSAYLEQDLQTSIAKCNSKVLNMQGPKDTNITSIINRLPPRFTFNKKLVSVEQDAEGTISHKNKINTERRSEKSALNNNDTNTNIVLQKKACDSIKKQQVSGKVVIKNGKRYIIKSLQNITKNPGNSPSSPVVSKISKTVKRMTFEHNTSTATSTSSSESENTGIEQAALLHNDTSLLPPSPSPSELSSNSGCESQIKQTLITSTVLPKIPPHIISICSTQKRHLFETISLIKENNGDIYMNIKLLDHSLKEESRDICEIIPEVRQEMIDEFCHLNSIELKRRINHLQHVSEEMREVMNFISDDVLKEKFRSINTLQRILEECLHKCKQDIQGKDDDDTLLSEWESQFKEIDIIYKCPSCNKIVKPKSYIAGFSKLPKNDNAYCSCYKYVCHKCLSYQGSLSRFITHQNFHKKSKPYICPDCCCKFTSAKFLEVHTWTVCFHTLKKHIFACKICEIDGFRDMESITRHFAIMHSDLKIACEDCFKVFPSYIEYKKHYTEIHSSVLKHNPIRLAMCKLSNDIVRFENYMLYLEKYPAIRKLIWFKCPFCPLVTVENKHMMAVLNAHLRDQHLHRLSEIISKEALADIFGTEFLEADISVPSDSSIDTFVNANDVSHKAGAVMPKIVNTRTITSEVFERGSQDTNDAWSKNSDGPVLSTVTDVNSRVTEEIVDDRKETNPLSKMFHVKSISYLKAMESQTTTTEVLNQTNKKSEVTETENVRKDLSCKDETEKMTVSDHKFANNQKTKETKESDKRSNKSISCISESEGSPLSETENVRKISLSELNRTVSNSEPTPKTSTDGRIKVIDIRKMCKPDIEPLVTAESCNRQTEYNNESYMISVLKPPPLARIPQHLFVSERAKGWEDGSKNIAKSKKSFLRNMSDKPKCRIAINGPVNMQDGYVDYLCHLCGEKINTSQAVVQSHFRENHSYEYRLMTINPQLLRLSSDFINGGYKQLLSNRKRKSDSVLFTSKRKRRWTPKKYTETKDVNLSGVGLCVEQETAEDGEGNFKCKKCDQRCTNMSNLREHIAANHRLKSHYFICLECGENFVVAPSLQMHLKAFHGIEDPICYMMQNPLYAPDFNSSDTEGKTTVANQCYVCMAVFENKATVDKHLRVHGMAFLNRKRIEARNALKSPEKKTPTEEEIQHSVKDNPSGLAKRSKPAETILEKLSSTI